MKNTIKQYKPFFSFLFKFLVFYLVFTFIYNSYLNQFDTKAFQVDAITKNVSESTVSLINLTENSVAQTYKHDLESSYKIIFHGKYISRIIEGCNSISVIILFASFVFAFSNKLLHTLIFILLGSVLIYVLNILRIALLVFALYYYPEYEEILHGTIFPLFIYGVVFILWVLWVTKFSGYVKKVA